MRSIPIHAIPRRSSNRCSRHRTVRQQRSTRLSAPSSSHQPWWLQLKHVSGRVFSWHGWPKVASLATAVAAVGALWFSGQSLRANEIQYEISEQGLFTERFSRAVEQLGSQTIDVRLGAIYSLERLARDSVSDHPAIFEILGAFIRTHAPATPTCTEPSAPIEESSPPVDVQAAATVIGRRDPAHDGPNRIDLSSSCLAGASLTDADLYGADLTGTRLAYTDLSGTDLTDASLTHADLYGADLSGATLAGTNLHQADLTGIIYNDSTTWTDEATAPPVAPR